MQDSSAPLELIFALKQRNVDKLEKLFWQVSEPTHTSYGKYLTMEQVHALVQPSQETLTTVLEWLNQFPGAEVKHLNDYLIVNVPKSVAEQMLDCEFHYYQHKATGKRIIRAVGDYSLPHHVARASRQGSVYSPLSRPR